MTAALRRRALVVGGTRGAGGAIAARLRADGATVLVAARGAPADVVADTSTVEGAATVVASVAEVDVIVRGPRRPV